MNKHIGFLVKGTGCGIIIGLLCSLCFDYAFGSQQYLPSSPTFTGHFARPLDAVLVSVVLWALMGLVFSAGACMFFIERWSLRKRTVVNFLICYCGFTPLACLAGWFPIDWRWLVLYTIIFIAIYVTIWLVSSSMARREVAAINAKIKNN